MVQCLIRYETCRSKQQPGGKPKVSESDSEFKEDSDIDYHEEDAPPVN